MIRLASAALLLGCMACSGAEAPASNAAAARETPAEPAAPAEAAPPVEAASEAAPGIVAAPAPAAAAPAPQTGGAAPLSAEELATYPEARGLPADVQRFIVRRQDCEHWAGEEPYDAARKRQIDKAVDTLCRGIDAEAAKVRRRHAGDAKVTATLDGLDSMGM